MVLCLFVINQDNYTSILIRKKESRNPLLTDKRNYFPLGQTVFIQLFQG